MLPPYAKKRFKSIITRPLRATDVLYNKMHVYNNEAKKILEYIIDQVKLQNKNSPALRELYLQMRKLDDIVLARAHKLAPHQPHKLESIEVKNQVEHRFVLRAPSPVQSVDQWAKLTGADTMKLDKTLKKDQKISDPAPSIHDFDNDEIETQRNLLN